MRAAPVPSEGETRDRATPRLLGWLVQVFLAVVALNVVLVVLGDGFTTGVLRGAPTATVAVVTGVLGLATWAAWAHALHETAADRRVRHLPRRLALLAALSLLPLPVLGSEWLTWAAFLGFGCVWWLPPVAGRVLYVVVLAAAVASWRLVTGSWDGLTFEVLSYVATSLLLYGLVFTARVATELARTRTQLAGARVLEERLRMSRDLHDVIGGNVVALSLKSELALRHVRQGDAVRAGEELAQVLGLTHATGSDLRSLVSGFRRPSLGTELSAGRRLLEDAGVRCEVVVDRPLDLPPEVEEDAAQEVRDAVSLVLRRSDVTAVTLTVAHTGSRLVVTTVHDGAAEDPTGRTPSPPAPGGLAP